MTNLTNKRVIITGASHGLGKEIARTFLRGGASVSICSRNGEELTATLKELHAEQAWGSVLFGIPCDISSPAEVRQFVSEAALAMGGVDVLINNAGTLGPIGRIEDVNLGAWMRAVEINLFGTLNMCREVIPLLKENALEPAPEAAAGDVLDVLGAVGAVPSTTPTTAAAAEAVPPSGTAPATSLPPPPPSRGKIISLSGGGATAPMPRCSAYAASKAAVVRITETMAEELREFAIDVNAVAPGAMRTRMMQEVVDAGPEKAGEAYHAKNVHWMEEGGTTDPSVGAALCAWLASTESNGITGKLLSAQWDPWQNLAAFRQDLRGDIYTLRRIVPEDRGKKFE